jgi:hypothetical protein
MKKILSTLALLALGYGAFAQTLNDKSNPANPEVSHSVVPKEEPAFVNTKAAKDFKKTFKGVSNEEWYEMPDGFRAKFTIGDIKYRVDFDKKGNYQHTERTYSEEYLPTDIRSIVKSSYYDYAITQVEEVKKPQTDITYIVHLEGKKDWINLRIQNSQMAELQKYNK